MAAKQEFLQYMIDQNLCQDTGLLQCSINDVTLECGIEASSGFGRRKRSSRMVLRFHFTVAIPETPRVAIDCGDICPRNSYCEEVGSRESDSIQYSLLTQYICDN